MREPARRRRARPIGALVWRVALAGLLGWYLAFLFQVDGLRLPDAGIGSWADPYFINFVLEQWAHAARTWSDPASPPMYYPAAGTLGYSHSLILYAPFYVAARLALPPFRAETATLLAVFALGIVCLYVVLRRGTGIASVPAAALTAVVASSPNIINTGTEMWMQRASLFLVPPVICLGVLALGRRTARARRFASGVVGFLAVSLVTQDASSGLLFFGVAGVLGLGLLALDRRRFVRHLWRTATRIPAERGRREPSRAWLWTAGFFLLLSVAIAIVPLDRTTVGRWRVSATDPMRPLRISALAAGWYVLRSLRWRGVTRAGRAARRAAIALLGAASRAIAPDLGRVAEARRRARACAQGALTGAAVGLAVFAWLYGRAMLDYRGFAPEDLYHNLLAVEPETWRDWRSVWRDLFTYDSVRPFVVAGAASVVAWIPLFQLPMWARRLGIVTIALSAFVWLVALRVGDFSLWAPLAVLVPGASIVRDPKRMMHFYELAAVTVAAVIVARARANRRTAQALLAALCVVLLVADGHGRRFHFDRSPAIFDRMVMQDVAADSRCRSFFAKPVPRPVGAPFEETFVPYSMHAAFLAQRLGLPTLNGYSAFAPRGWTPGDPQEPGYLDDVRDWIVRKGLTGVCVADFEARTMVPFE